MPLVPDVIAAQAVEAVKAEMKSKFGSTVAAGGGEFAASAEGSQGKLAEAVAAAVTKTIIQALLTQAIVTTSTGPGKIT